MLTNFLKGACTVVKVAFEKGTHKRVDPLHILLSAH